ncbi:DMT family transporter [Reyranella sp.]|uniref:DMT family transporter n=1 Tax=Reyranella sp. TaxID=1929291 RepID=UPI003782DAD6
MMREHRHLLGAFAAMIFVGASWGANVPVSKVMLAHFDLIPMSAIRTAVATVGLAVLLLLVEGVRALRIDVGVQRFAVLGLLMASFFFIYTLGLLFTNPITAAAVQVAGPLVAAATVRIATGLRFDPGFPVALALTLAGGGILASSSLVAGGPVSFGGGEIFLLASNILWTLYSLKAQAWFDRASQLHRAYVASLSALGWATALSAVLIVLGWSRSPFNEGDPWVWTQLVTVALLASGLGGYFWNIGASRLGVAIASLWVNLVPFFAVLWAMAYGFMPNAYQIVGGLVALSGVVYMQWRKLQASKA